MLLVLGAVGFVGAGSAAAQVSANYSNVIFSDGFDSGSLSNWSGTDGTGKASVMGAAAYSGADGLRLTNAKGQYSWAYKQLSTPVTDSSTRFWVRINAAASGFSGTNLAEIAEARNAQSSADMWELIYDTKQQGLWFLPYQQQNGQSVFTGPGSLPLGSWNQIEVRYDAASSGGAELLINGQTKSAWNLSGNYTRRDNVQSIQLWNDAANGTDFDSVVVGTPGSASPPPPPPPPSAPSNTALPVVSGTAQQGQALSTSNGSWSGSPTSYSYQWEDCNSSGASCTLIGGATSSSYTLVAGDVGHTVRSVVTASNGGGSTAASSAQTAVVTAPQTPPSPPANMSPPVESGTAQAGHALSTSNGSWSGSPTSYSYQWQDCNSSGVSCSMISGATGSSYMLGSGDVGHTVRSVVTATNAGGSTPASSAQSAMVTSAPPSPPSNTALPVVSGTTQQGQVLSTTSGSWSGSPTSYSYQWEDCNSSGASCTVISGATSSSYTLAAGDVGHTIRSVVTATNAGGSTAASSAQTAAITASGGGGGGAGGVVMGFDVACDLAPSNPWADMTQDFLFTLQTTNGSSLDTAGQCVSSLNVPNWVAAVHAHNEQAFITIGGIADQDWPTACNSTNRAAFVTNLVNYMKTNGFDGIDLDIEDNAWAAQNPPVAAWDACVQAISTAAHATTTASGARPLVSEDVTTPWMGVYLTNDVSYIDQFNLMTYGESTSQVGSDVASSVAAGIPKSKSVIGVDIVDYGEPSGGCGQYGSYAQQQGLAGVMVWDIHSDAQGGSFPCFTGLGPYAG